MPENFNISNLTLDDNTFEVLPDGDYHFTVESYEVGYYSGDSVKIPANTQQVTYVLDVPFIKEGLVSHAKVKTTLNIYAKAMFAVRQFVECIGMAPEKGQTTGIDLTKAVSRKGICALTTMESKNGNEFNRVNTFYPPSKAPTVTANDAAWNNLSADGFMGVPDDIDF